MRELKEREQNIKQDNFRMKKTTFFFKYSPRCDSVWPLSGTGVWDNREKGAEKRNDREIKRSRQSQGMMGKGQN